MGRRKYEGDAEERRKAAQAAYSAKNKDKISAYNKARYLAGKTRPRSDLPCFRCSEKPRAKSSTYCVDCRSEIRRAFREKNRERIGEQVRTRRALNPDKTRAENAKWKLANPDKVREEKRRYRQRHKDAIAAYFREWRNLNPDKAKAISLTRRARSKRASGYATAGQIAARFAYFGNVCAYCGGPAESVDHVIPLAKGGSHWPANLRPACKRCNSAKRDLPVDEFLMARSA